MNSETATHKSMDLTSFDTAYLTVSDVSHYLKIPEETIYKYVRTGRIPASKLGKHWRFARVEIDKWVGRQSGLQGRTFQVLVVDDDPSIRKLLSRWLTDAGCQILTAENGQAALEIVRSGAALNLITLDLQMPGMNGVETLKQIRILAPKLMVAIISGDFDGSLMDQALALNPIMAMKKPIHREALLNMINCLIGCGRGVELIKD